MVDFDDITEWFSNLGDIDLGNESAVVVIIFFAVSIVIWGSRLMNPMLTFKTTVMMQIGALIGCVGAIIYFRVKG